VPEYVKLDIFRHLFRKKFINQKLGVNICHITTECAPEIASGDAFDAPSRRLSLLVMKV
jgi:hypothetical protein